MLKFQSWSVAIVLGGVLFLSTAGSGFAADAGRKTLHGHVPAAVARLNLQPVGRLPATQQLHLAIGLPLRNEDALNSLLQEIYDPGSANFHQYLTPEQFTEQFGPTEQDYQAVVDFAERNGLTVTATSASRMLLDVSGPVANIERAFQVTMRTYQHPSENRRFYAPDVEPSVEIGLSVLDVSGLDNYTLPHPKNVRLEAQNQPYSATPKAGSGPNGNYIGNDFRAAYVPGTALTGSGQMVGLLQFDGFYSNDITAYETKAGLPAVPLQTVLVDSYNGAPTTAGNIEVSLDIEMSMSMAPGLSKIILFEAGPSGIPNDVLNAMASTNQVGQLAKQLSCSWGWGGGPSGTTDGIFKKMAMQGQSFFNASGDSDAFTTGSGSINGVDNSSLQNAPSSSTNITQVGGTTLSTTGPAGSWSSETVWNWGGGVGGSGGISSYYTIPSWQTNINMPARGGSATQRNTPDVALTADTVFVKYGNGLNATNLGGTSCAAPLWAGFMALVNQQGAANGNPSAGFINPAIYTIAAGPGYAASFHDITTGNNTWSSSPNLFYATNGYDLCTGLGTPNGDNLIATLNNDPLQILPGNGFTSAGVAGGPFTVTAQNFSLTNVGAAPLNWSAVNTPLWLTASPASGTLVSGGQTTVNVSLTASAATLAAGIYYANLLFTNQTTHIVQNRQFTLLVGQPVILNGGFETGDFTGWTLNGDSYNTVVNTSSFVHSGGYGVALGQTSSSPLGYLYQTLTTSPGQNYLLSLWLENPNNSYGATPNQFLVQWDGTTVFNQSNIPFTAWTNLQFIVTATSSGTVLQFGFYDAPYYLGLDDISVVPIPLPTFKTTVKTGSTFNLAFGTVTGLVYQVQYKTNLLQAVWNNLGKPIIANTSTLTVSDTNAFNLSPHRFYRLMMSSP